MDRALGASGFPRPQSPSFGDDLAASVADFLPSWLVSLVVHLSLILVLALVATGSGAWSGGGTSLDVDAGGFDLAGGGSSELEDAIALPSELPEETVVEPVAQAPDAPVELAQVAPQLKLPEAAAGPINPQSAPSLAGSGSGMGDGNGDGDEPGGDGLGIGPVKTRIFGLAAEGTRFVYVFDRSESMSSVLSYSSEGKTIYSITPIDAAKAELLASLEDLKPEHRFGIVFYNHEPWRFNMGRYKAGLYSASTANKRQAAEFIASMYAQGMTEHTRPVELALRMRPDVIFLMTDGEEKDDPTVYQLEHLRKLNSGHTRINVVQFCYKQRSGGTLVQLAEENGGSHIYVNLSRLGPGMHKGFTNTKPAD